MTRLRFRKFCLALLPLAFLLTGCDSGGSGGGKAIDNEFSMTITPSSSESAAAVPKVAQKDLNGYSFFVDTDDLDNVDDQAFVIYFNGNDSFSESNATQGLFGFVGRESGQPGTGEFTITGGATGTPTSSEFVGWLYEDLRDMQSAPFYVINSGTLTLSTSNDDKVSGIIGGTATAYTFTGTDYTTEVVNVSGTFTAKSLDTFVPYGSYAGSPAQ